MEPFNEWETFWPFVCSNYYSFRLIFHAFRSASLLPVLSPYIWNATPCMQSSVISLSLPSPYYCRAPCSGIWCYARTCLLSPTAVIQLPLRIRGWNTLLSSCRLTTWTGCGRRSPSSSLPSWLSTLRPSTVASTTPARTASSTGNHLAGTLLTILRLSCVCRDIHDGWLGVSMSSNYVQKESSFCKNITCQCSWFYLIMYASTVQIDQRLQRQLVTQ